MANFNSNQVSVGNTPDPAAGLQRALAGISNQIQTRRAHNDKVAAAEIVRNDMLAQRDVENNRAAQNRTDKLSQWEVANGVADAAFQERVRGNIAREAQSALNHKDAQGQITRNNTIQDSNLFAASLDPTVALVGTNEDVNATEARTQAIAGLKAQAELDRKNIPAAVPNDANYFEDYDNIQNLIKTSKEYKPRVASSVRTPTADALVAQQGLDAMGISEGNLPARFNNYEARSKQRGINTATRNANLTNIDRQLQSALTQVDGIRGSQGKALSVPEYRTSLTTQFSNQLPKHPSKRQQEAVRTRVNNMTNAYQSALQDPLAKQAEFKDFTAREQFKQAGRVAIAEIKKKASSFTSNAEALQAKAYLDRIDRSRFTDDDTVEYDAALGIVNDYINRYNKTKTGRANPETLVKDTRF